MDAVGSAGTGRLVSPAVSRVDAAAFVIPTDGPESDGTIEWSSTTMVVVRVEAGGVTGIGYTYGHESAATLIRRHAPDTSMAVCLDCHRSVEGNPWLLSELGRRWRRSSSAPHASRTSTTHVPASAAVNAPAAR